MRFNRYWLPQTCYRVHLDLAPHAAWLARWRPNLVPGDAPGGRGSR